MSLYGDLDLISFIMAVMLTQAHIFIQYAEIRPSNGVDLYNMNHVESYNLRNTTCFVELRPVI